MLVRVEEPMRVAPGGHVIDLKAGDTIDGALADYLVNTRCNVTVLDDAAAEDNGDGDGDGDGALTATLAASAEMSPDADPADKPKPRTRATKTAK